MIRVQASLLDVSQPYKGILSDAFGVFWNGSGLYPGVLATFEALVGLGKVVVILSNATASSEKEEAKYAKHGLIKGKHYHALITSGEVAKTIFSREELPFELKSRYFWVFGDDHARYGSPHEAIFAGSSFQRTHQLEEASFIYIGIPTLSGEDQEDPQVFEESLKNLLKTGLTMVCANPDRFVQEGSPARKVVRQGQIAQMYEKMGGAVYFIGKPGARVYEAAAAFFHSQGVSSLKEALMVGDNPETDIQGAHGMGMASALTTTTGLSGDEIKIQGLEAYWAQLLPAQRPTYLIEALAQA